jgi:uncharacterized RDD family membrane protein YckC
MKYFAPDTFRRLCALVIDSIITSGFAAPLFVYAFITSPKNEGLLLPWTMLAATWLMQLGYHVLFIYILKGSIGKLICGLRIVPFHNPNEKLMFMQAVLRVLTDQFGFFFGHAHRALVFFRLDRRHLSDWIAETRVVQNFPRSRIPARRWIVGLIALWVLATAGLQESYELIQKLEIKKAGVLLPANFNVSIQFKSEETI